MKFILHLRAWLWEVRVWQLTRELNSRKAQAMPPSEFARLHQLHQLAQRFARCAVEDVQFNSMLSLYEDSPARKLRRALEAAANQMTAESLAPMNQPASFEDNARVSMNRDQHKHHDAI